MTHKGVAIVPGSVFFPDVLPKHKGPVKVPGNLKGKTAGLENITLIITIQDMCLDMHCKTLILGFRLLHVVFFFFTFLTLHICQCGM